MLSALRSLALATSLMALLPGCLSENQRSFSLSRSFFEEGGIDNFARSLGPQMSMTMACGVVAVMAVPVAADIVILPVTLPLDLWDEFHASSAPEESADWDESEERPSAQLPQL